MPDGGLTVMTSAFVENATSAVLLAVDHIDHSAGDIYNVGDDRQFTYAQIAEIVGDELGCPFEPVSVPWEFAATAGPFIHNHSSTHRILSTEKIRQQLGYRDKVDPEEGMRHTVRWQAENLSGSEDAVARLQDPFDYAAEDALIAATQRYAGEVGCIEWAQMPGWSFGYYGPHENPGGRRGSFRA